jgi:hypothetical protein
VDLLYISTAIIAVAFGLSLLLIRRAELLQYEQTNRQAGRQAGSGMMLFDNWDYVSRDWAWMCY